MGNFNNEIGLPLSLLRLEKGHEWAVVELGMNHIGEIRNLARICLPDIGVITNIGPAHLEGVGSIEGVMQAKGELLSEIHQEGAAVLNADDPRILKLSQKTGARALFYGFSEKAAVRGTSFRQEENRICFTIILPDSEISVDLEAYGDFMASNSLAAAAVGYLAGLPASEIKKGIEKFQPIKGRMNVHRFKNDIKLIDDTYNANPDSVRSAVRSLVALKKGKRGILVLGDMFELGEHSEEMHKKIGELVAEVGIEKLFAVGRFSESVAEGARSGGMNRRSIFNGSGKEILVHLRKEIKPGDWVLIKGSRAMKMEDIVEALTEEFL
jgi:UDP-N-acetylmuramoyl-tripeptide--D-alanyl-D-alanine ligase